MTKKNQDYEKKALEKQNEKSMEETQFEELQKKLPKEAREKLAEIKTKLDKFKDKVLEKFEAYVLGIALMPPKKPDEQDKQKAPLEEINVLVLIDDSDSKKMSKDELKTKIVSIIEKFAEEVDKSIKPQIFLLSETWQSCFDSKYDVTQLIALSAPIYDKGMLATIKIAEVHKTMVLKKFEKYIVSYVLAGSIMQGKAKPESDIDVFVVIDDTDVKRMTRTELKDKLRAIIIGMGFEASQMTGIKGKLHIQVYILTEFWDGIREANPIFFTFLRDGVPLYDRGLFMPWKQLLSMGKIKPSMEAIDMYMGSGEKMLERVKFKLNEIGMEDICWAILTPTQAAVMMYGLPPPAPSETAQVMNEIFVKKEKLLEEKYVKIIENIYKTRKEMEHGIKKDISGKEVDELVKDGEAYLKRLQKLFTQIERRKEDETMKKIYETVVTIGRDVLKLESVNKVKDDDLIKVFKETLIETGKLPAKHERTLKDIFKAKEDFDKSSLVKSEVDNVRKISGEFVKEMIDYIQRIKSRELEKAKVRIKHSKDKYGEVTLLENTAFILYDINEKDKLEKAGINPDGSLGETKKAALEEFEKALSESKPMIKVLIKEPLFESLKKIFGKDFEIIFS